MSSSNSRRRKVVVNTVSVKLGCNCRRPRLSSFFNPKPKSKLPSYQKHAHQKNYSQQSSSSSWDKTGNWSSEYPTISTPSSSCSTVDKSVAIEKDSNDPYLDFRQSMLQMIVENQIYSKEDLKHLLNCFLQLNSPALHGVIIRVFTEIWNSFFFASRPAPATNHHSPSPAPPYFQPKFYEI